MNTLPDLSQLTHEQLLEFTRQLAMQHQQLTEDKRHLESSNQILEQENKYLDALNQQYKHEIDLFKRHKFAQKNEHLTAKQISLLDEAVYVIDKGIASPELLSYVQVSKYVDHLPLYRQRLIYQRVGVDLARSTLSLAKRCFSDWSVWCAIRTFSPGTETDCITATRHSCR